MTPPSRAADTPIPTTSLPLPVRIDLLGDADPDVRLKMTIELGEGRHEEGAAALVARFGVERDFFIRETLTWAVLRMPDAALPLVRQALRSPRWLTRLQATHTLSKLGAYEDGQRLAPLVADPVDVVAARAYWAVAQCGDPSAIPALVVELSRGSTAHQNSLTVALSHFGSATVPALIAALRRSGSAQVRRHAADTLAYLGSPDADPATHALADAVGDPDEAVRVAALNALGQLVTPGAWRVIDDMAESPHPRLALLASRLAERRPSEGALRRAAARGTVERTEDDDLVGAPAPEDRSWPSPSPGLVTCEGGPWAQELVPKLALQVEVCRPQYLSRTDVPADVADRVRAEAYAQADARGRPQDIAQRIAAGRVEQFIHEHVLLEQVSVADPGMIVKDLLLGTEVRITDFVRLPAQPPDEQAPR